MADRLKLEVLFQRLILIGLCGFVLTSPWSVAGAGGAIILSLVGWGGKVIFTEGIRWIRSPLDLPILAYLGAQFLSLCFSPYTFNSLKAFRNEWIVLLFFLLVNNLQRERAIDNLLKVLFLVTSLVSIYACWQHFFGWDFYRHHRLEEIGGVFSSTGLFGNRLTYGGYVMVICIFAVVFFLWGEKRWRPLYGSCALLTGLGVVFSDARSSWLGLIGGFLSMAIVKGKKVSLVMIAGLTILGTVVIFTQDSVKDRILAGFNPEVRGTGTRLRLWQTSLLMLKDHPFLGIGIGNFRKSFDKYKVPGYYTSTCHPHNDLLNVGVNAGLLGMLAFLWIWWAFWRASLQGYRNTSHPIFLGGFSSSVAFFLASFFQCYYTDAEDGMLLWFVFGLVMAFYGKQMEQAG